MTFTTRAAALAMIMTASIAFPGPAANAAGPVVCMTDEGGGRMKPCDAGYKAANPHWESMDTCFTDEGGGRFKACDSNYKAQALERRKQQQK